MLSGRRVVLGVSGGIAAYKAAEVARALVKSGCEVSVVMTASACRFITPLTFRALTRRPVATELFADTHSAVPHVSLARWAELVLVAPATADVLARAAQGRASDLLAALILDTTAPVLWAPAMNATMWSHPLTQANLRRLAALGHRFVPPGQGDLACGEQGAGRLAETGEILAAVQRILSPSGPLAGKRVLVTAGPTREVWDAVRFLSNRSSGRMGYALAAEARDRGAQVTLVSGPVSLPAPDGVQVVRVTSALEMQAAVQEAFPAADVVMAAAAVADFRPARPSQEKIKKGQMPPVLELTPNPDILAELGRSKTHQLLVGFAAETAADLEGPAQAKLRAKHLDLIVANHASGAEDAFGAETTSVLLLTARGQKQEILQRSKPELAAAILDLIENLLAQ